MKKERVLFWIITGMSGAGKSQAINCFEDFGYFCVDNLPVALVPKMAELCSQPERPLKRVVLGIDVREGGFLRGFLGAVDLLKKQGFDCKIVFMDADERTLYRRFSETRRRHPLGTSVQVGIKQERHLLLKIKEKADKIIDTTDLTLAELKQRISELMDTRNAPSEMQLSVQSFGYKYGLPVDADLVWDVRFMPNPNYKTNLREKTGRHVAVKRYVMGTPQAKRFGKKYFNLVKESLPHYIREGKSYLTVAIGCTGGRHRSVVMAEELARYLTKFGYKVRTHHRDIDR